MICYCTINYKNISFYRKYTDANLLLYFPFNGCIRNDLPSRFLCLCFSSTDHLRHLRLCAGLSGGYGNRYTIRLGLGSYFPIALNLQARRRSRYFDSSSGRVFKSVSRRIASDVFRTLSCAVLLTET
jgi:hypothetical protein